jgi:uncharacterized protein YutE (UPF0331/DUF86 family)
VAVAARIEFARTELADLAEYASLDWVAYQADARARRNVERIADNVANATIDIAKILLAAGRAAVPETYRDVLAATVPAGLADASEAAELVQLARLRNTLAHRYLDYKWEILKWFLEDGRLAVARWLDRCERRIA